MGSGMNGVDYYLKQRLDGLQPKLAWASAGRGRGKDWQLELRLRLAELLGGLEEPSPFVAGGEEEPVSGEGYCLRKVRFATRPGLEAIGYWLEPDGPPRASMLCLPGHGQGVAAIVGLEEEPYQANFALQCARRGYRVLALEPIGFGERASSRAGDLPWSCDVDAKTALMLGESLLGWRVYEALRSADWLLAKPDSGRLGVMGISGGGTVALWAAALDERFSAATISGAFCTYRKSILAIDHCLDNFVPGVLPWIDMPDLAGLIAPRGLFVENGTEDPIFPIDGFDEATAEASEMYADFGCPEQFSSERFEGGHEFRGESAFHFLDRVLG